MITLTLNQISAALGGTLRLAPGADGETQISGETQTDSRRLTAGGIFIALAGEKSNGHLFVPAAIETGVALIIIDREHDHDHDVSVSHIVVEDTLTALADLAKFVVATVRSNGALKVIGITGSNGKTTTKNLLRAMLSSAGPTIAPPESLNNQVGAPLSMLSINPETNYLVVEMGASGVGDIARIVDIAMPDIAVVLKVGLAHAGEFGGVEQTARAKSEIVTALPPQAVAVLNADDERVVRMAGSTPARPFWFGLDVSADVCADNLNTTLTGTGFTLVVGQLRRPVRLQLIGEHQVMNALAAVAVVLQLGIDLDLALAALESVPRAERWRMEVLNSTDGIVVINDAYNASPDSMSAALKTLAQIVGPEQRSVAVLGEMTALGEYSDEEHDRIGRLVVRLNIQKLIVVGHGARHIHNAAGLEGSWDGESVLVANADEAQELIRADLRAGDVVLVKASNSANLRELGDRIGEVA